MAICTYCQDDTKLTREHIWSNAVLRLFDDEAPLTFDDSRGLVHPSDPLLKDLCGPCNQALSPADAAGAAFVSKHCLAEINAGEPLEIGNPELRRWVAKTACNMERSNGARGNDWWRPCIPSFRYGDALPNDVQILFAPWLDQRPAPLPEVDPIRSLEACTIATAGSSLGKWKQIWGAFDRGWALKVGKAVFLLLAFAPKATEDFRNHFIAELRSYGWLHSGTDTVVHAFPFNIVTARTFWLLSDPHDPLAFRREK